MAAVSLRMLTMCLIAAAVLNCTNYMFVKFYYNPVGQRIQKYYYPKTSSGMEVPRSLELPVELSESLICGNTDPAPTINEQEIKNISLSPSEYLASDDDNYCPQLPPGLGPISDNDSQMTIQEFEMKYGEVRYGGIYQPSACKPRHSVAIIIAYRGCRRYLAMFLMVLHPLLIKQQLDYQIFVIEQSNNSQLFNRGKLLNIGFTEAQKYRKTGWDCLILHEAHLVPTDSRNLYRCSWYPRQLAVYVERENK
ncbi:beta-1,4-N-acetylgalactosaminyltransferase bre-4-like [Anticarsia gemmatalis]|uniref:beta-1,4-N-acetylgalactosaminyltransferase bre-4-like n=1 Tax=Anticarsia gemmatalis TaxID=129554 RepID=UPI003F777EAF